jgi:hypothetical protein
MTNKQDLVSKPYSVTITVGSNFEGIIDSGNKIISRFKKTLVIM